MPLTRTPFRRVARHEKQLWVKQSFAGAAQQARQRPKAERTRNQRRKPRDNTTSQQEYSKRSTSGRAPKIKRIPSTLGARRKTSPPT